MIDLITLKQQRIREPEEQRRVLEDIQAYVMSYHPSPQAELITD